MPRCFAYQSPVFTPAMRLIAAITNSSLAVVTTTFAHGYISGTIVRFDLPLAVGMQQLNQATAPITVTGTTTFTIPIDTTLYAPFAIPGSPSPQTDICAQVVPIGETNDILAAAVVNVL